MIERGVIVLAELDPIVGSEHGKVRSVVVVSNDSANRVAVQKSGVITVVPVTSSLSHVFDFQVRLLSAETGLPRDGKAQCEQVRSISLRRVVREVGRVSSQRLTDIDEALRLHLDL